MIRNEDHPILVSNKDLRINNYVNKKKDLRSYSLIRDEDCKVRGRLNNLIRD